MYVFYVRIFLINNNTLSADTFQPHCGLVLEYEYLHVSHEWQHRCYHITSHRSKNAPDVTTTQRCMMAATTTKMAAMTWQQLQQQESDTYGSQQQSRTTTATNIDSTSWLQHQHVNNYRWPPQQPTTTTFCNKQQQIETSRTTSTAAAVSRETKLSKTNDHQRNVNMTMTTRNNNYNDKNNSAIYNDNGKLLLQLGVVLVGTYLCHLCTFPFSTDRNSLQSRWGSGSFDAAAWERWSQEIKGMCGRLMWLSCVIAQQDLLHGKQC